MKTITLKEGERFGRLTVIQELETIKQPPRVYITIGYYQEVLKRFNKERKEK